jgi:glucokinase
VQVVAGIDLGGTAINYTFFDLEGRPLLEGLCEYPARAKEGPDICLEQIAEGLGMAMQKVGVVLPDIVVVGLDTPGPASADGVLSARGSTNFAHPAWANYDIRESLAKKLGKPVTYINDGNAAALWGHFHIFGDRAATSVSAIVGTGLGGGIVLEGQVLKGRKGFGGELGHMLIPYQNIRGIEGLVPQCNCGRVGDLESVCSLTAIEKTYLPFFLKRYPDHEFATVERRKAAKLVRGHAEQGDAMCRDIFRAQAHALGLFFDAMINAFDPNALLIGGGALETAKPFQEWFITELRSAMPEQREEQADIPIYVMPNGDTAGARGAAVEALRLAKSASIPA